MIFGYVRISSKKQSINRQITNILKIYPEAKIYQEIFNYIKAFEWFQKAAIQENTNAQCKIGEFYENGLGVNKNYEKAIQWYKKSSEKGNLIASKKLSSLKYSPSYLFKKFLNF